MPAPTPLFLSTISTGPLASQYDTRFKSDGAEWISRAVVDDIRRSLALSIDRYYRGQEFDSNIDPWLTVQTNEALCHRTPDLCRAPARQEPPADGLATAITNPAGMFRSELPLEPSPVTEMLGKEPGLRIFIAGGIFDDLFPCAIGQEMARRDLASFSNRVQSKCYLGGHMMYDELAVGAELTADVRAFIGQAKETRRH